jgi:hypothetical protein
MLPHPEHRNNFPMCSSFTLNCFPHVHRTGIGIADLAKEYNRWIAIALSAPAKEPNRKVLDSASFVARLKVPLHFKCHSTQ